MKQRNLAPVLLAAALVSAIALAPSVGARAASRAASAPRQTVTIQFANWVTAETATRANMLKVIAAFEKQHPGVKVVNTAIPFETMYQQLVTMASAGNLPDVIQLNGPWPAELGAANDLVDLTAIAGPHYLKDNYPGALAAGAYGGKIYAMPLSLTPHALWYDKNLMRQAGLDPNKPPTTMAALNADLAQIKVKLGSKGVYGIGLDTSKIDYALTEFFPFFYAYGARPLYNNRPNFDTKQVANALQWLRDDVKEGYTPTGQDVRTIRELMAKNKIVFRLDGPYLVGILRSLNPALNGGAFYDTWGVTTVPVGVSGTSYTLADLHQIGISTQSKNKALDWAFIKFLESDPASIEGYQIPYGVIPALKSVETAPRYAKAFSDPVSQEYIHHVFGTMIAGPYGPKFGQQLQLVIQAMQEAALTSTPVSQIQQQTQQALQGVSG